MKSRSLLPYCICLINLVTTAALNYALVGKSITFETGINTPEPPDDILWKHNGNKMVEFDGQQQKPFNPFIDRITLNWHTAELTIANLKYEDSGDYVVEVFANKKLYPASFQLEVIDPVPKPSISCKINAGGNATLTCSAEVKGPRTKLEFSWTPPGNEKSSSKLEIKLADKQDSQVYECKVKTQLSEESASFTAKDCYIEETSAGMIAGILGGLLLVLLVIVFVFCLYKKGYLFKQRNVGGYDEEKQTQLGSANDVKDGIEEERRLLVREETMPSTQPLYQRKTDKFQEELRRSVRQHSSKNQQDESPSVLPQPPLKPSRSIVSPSKSQTHNEESEVNGDTKEKEPESDPLPSEKASDVEPEKNQHEIPSSPPQPPLKPSRSIVSPSKSQTHNKEDKVNGDAERKGPDSDPLPSEKAADVEPGSEQNQNEIISPLLTVPVEQHNTEHPHAKEAIKETEAKVSESATSGREQKTGAESDSEKKKEEVSSLTSVQSSASVPPTDTKEATEQAENPKENSSGIDPPVSKETAVVLPGSDAVGDEHEQPKCSADTSVSAPAEPPASPVTQNVPKTPSNEAVDPEGNGCTGPASPEPSERKAEQPEVKDSQNIIEVKTPPPPTPEPNPAGAGTQTGAGQQEEDKRVPPAEEEESQKENSHLSDHEQDEGQNSELEESFQTPPCSPKRSPKEAKAGSDSSSGEDQSKEDEGEAALSDPKHSQ